MFVLWTHSLRKRFGLTYFYALLGSITVIMSWVTDAGAAIEVFGITFMVGSTVFYTSLLLGVFVVYVFDGPTAARTAIFTVAGVSIMVPLVAALLHFQSGFAGSEQLLSVPVPSLRINTASVVVTILDLVFLAVVWEFLGKPHFRVKLWTRAFVTLLGVMLLDVLLFSTGAFLGTPWYLSIMQGTMISRLVISIFAFPLLYLYISWQNKQSDTTITNRPVLSILREVADVRKQLSSAQEEIDYRKRNEQEKEALIAELRITLNKVKKLENLLPVCASCRRIRIKSEKGEKEDSWISMGKYILQETSTELSHGICPECAKVIYPDLSQESEKN
ncbi:MAG: VUT family protein [Candidatus Sabulitectum sp.]|nr:VUT family protein [Candidatus Sabulitectum sp.]